MSPSPDLPAVPAVAIVGMACRFPGAADVHEFWRNLRDGVESISTFSDEELLAAGVDPAQLRDPNYVRAGGVVADSELFDAAFFDFNPREAEILDPQQRLFLECAWTALEAAGYGAGDGRPVAVFAGASFNTYVLYNLYNRRELIETVGWFQSVVGNDKDFLASRVAYKLNLRGPAVTVQTACSTSLVAVHLACQGLLGCQFDMALAGGVSVFSPAKTGYLYQEGEIRSPDGHCRAFDARARGTVGGTGAGVVVLKRLEDALADGDHVHAVIRGTAINNDGSDKVGYSAPGVAGQAEVIQLAQEVAGVAADEITYVEAHGSGTELGDRVEVAALTEAFRASTSRRGFCALGSVKTNIGHLDVAAGVAGLIKTALALEHRLIPPSLHFETPNPAIDFASSPFRVNARLADWTAEAPRRAGVSSFGLGGTNAHAVLEEAPAPEPHAAPPRPWHLFVLSARTATALDAATANLAACLRDRPGLDPADVAFTLRAGRRRFPHRRILVAADLEEAAAALETRDPRRLLTAQSDAGAPAVVFMLPGGGAQHPDMARGLYAGEPVFRAEVDRGAEILAPHLGLDLRSLLYPPPEQRETAAGQLRRPSLGLPALFLTEYALARLWISWGIRPAALIGHSMGEYVAACLAGVFSLADALSLVLVRGRLFEKLPRGAMLGVSLSEDAVRELAGEGLSIAAVNTPEQCVVSGEAGRVAAFASRLAERGVELRQVHIDVAAHSRLVEPILPDFRDFVRQLPLLPPELPLVSNVTGTWMTAAQATDPDYWTDHLRHAVRFADGLGEVLRAPDRLLLEVGPGQTLTALARLQSQGVRPRRVLASLPHASDPQPDMAFLYRTLGTLWLEGAELDEMGLAGGCRVRRVPLPTYPFERRRYWVEPAPQGSTAPAHSGKDPDVDRWFYLPAWRRTLPPRPPQAVEPGAPWLVLADAGGLGTALAVRLADQGHDVFTVVPGPGFARAGSRAFEIDPRRPEDYRSLLRELRAEDRLPRAVVHLWSLGAPAGEPGPERFAQAQERGYYPLLFLAQAFEAVAAGEPLRLEVIADGLAALAGDEETWPEKATLLGPCKVVPQEYPNVLCRVLDVRPGEALVERLLAELETPPREPVVAWRGPRRWVQTFEPVRLDAAARALRPGGVYLLTGGLGSVGLQVAEHLARSVQARLVLVGRGAPDPATAERVRRLEELGAQVQIEIADVADAGQMAAVVARAEERFGRLHGAFHLAAVTRGRSILSPIPEIGRAESEEQFHPKVHGLYALDAALAGRDLDFCLLFSSNASVLGGLGLVAYAAANLFLDAVAAQREGREGVPWIAATWDAWEDPRDEAATRTSMDVYRMTRAESLAALDRVLGAAGQVVVSTGDLAPRLARWLRREPAPDAAAEAPELHARPALRSDYASPRNEIERRIVAICEELLGVDPVGIHDNFFELGGHSLLATRLMTRLRDLFGVRLPLRTLFDGPSVADLAVRVAEALAAPEPVLVEAP